MAKAVDRVGQVIGRLTILSLEGRHPAYGWALWKARCSCGVEKVYNSSQLQVVQSWGCLRREKTSERRKLLPDADNLYLCRKCKERKPKDDMCSTGRCKDCAKLYRATWYSENQAEAIAYSKEWRAANPDQERRNNAQWRINNPAKVLLSSAKQRAKRKGWDFNLTLEDIVVPERCPVLGILLFGRGHGVPMANSATLDRLDNSKGYVKGNVTVISWRANALKKDATVEEVEKLLMWMKSQGAP